MRVLFITMIVFFGALSCAQSSTDSETVTKRISKSEFKEKMDSLEEYQLVDVRTPGEYQGGTIDNAVNIDYTSSDFEVRINELDKSTPVLIFCQAGGRSTKALKVFEQNGFEVVYELEGGYGNW